MSTIIRDQPFLWLDVDDKPSPDSDRAYIERNSIALLSNFEKPSIDPRADDWLGRDSVNDEIHHAGLWNVNHTDETHDRDFLDTLAEYVDQI